ncbi:MAG: redoxin domain-containing protein [Longimicrobiales bacterium]|nr:redoxin domain-containing protein [Longimicrobiales bacterium]
MRPDQRTLIRIPSLSRNAGVLLAVMIAATGCEAAPELGPVDGRDLPPTDTGRVALADTAPDFTLEDRHGDPVTLSRLQGRVILVFYRGHW